MGYRIDILPPGWQARAKTLTDFDVKPGDVFDI
jgi:hypothetical protein